MRAVRSPGCGAVTRVILGRRPLACACRPECEVRLYHGSGHRRIRLRASARAASCLGAIIARWGASGSVNTVQAGATTSAAKLSATIDRAGEVAGVGRARGSRRSLILEKYPVHVSTAYPTRLGSVTWRGWRAVLYLAAIPRCARHGYDPLSVPRYSSRLLCVDCGGM